MPTYDYVCAACGHALEIFHSMSEAPKKKCPECGKPKLERQIGAGAGFLFKGQGFYKTDYRSDSYKAGEKAESAPAASTDATTTSASEKTSDTKSAESKTTAAKPAQPEAPKSVAKPDSKSKSKRTD